MARSRGFVVRRYRELVAALCGVAAGGAVLAGPELVGPIDGRLFDLALGAASLVSPQRAVEHVAVVALDRRSLDSDELRDTPRVFLGPVWAKALDGLFAAGARSVAFDIIFAYDANRFRAIEPNYDWPFSDALGRYRDRVVLGRSVQTPVADSYLYPLFDEKLDAANAQEPSALGYVELFADDDGVHRWLRRDLPIATGGSVPSLAAAALARAGGPAMPERVLLARRAPLESLPAYSLVDVLRCARSAPERLAEAFAGKVVAVGGVLAEEDRKAVPDRFVRRPPFPAVAPGTDGCTLTRLGPSSRGGDTVPGVFIHAAAIDGVLSGDLATLAPRAARATVAVGAALAGAALGFALAPWWIAGIGLVGFALLFAVEAALLPLGVWAPMGMPLIALVVALVAAYLARFLVEQRKRRRVQHAFGHFLSPLVVDRLVDEDEQLRLGGELRSVTVLFADLSGFTALSGRVAPDVLMAVTNRYLGLLVEAVESTGGYVDKFIGDAVMAIWGAPAGDLRHAQNASRSALLAIAEVERTAAEDRARGEPAYSVKIGVNSGNAIVGNVGAAQRFNYTAVGEAVNIASRLEGLPGDYACRVVVGPATAAAVAAEFLLCELDYVRVKGKSEPIPVYELLCAMDEAGEREHGYVAGYGDALAAWKAGRFAEAQAIWQALVHPRKGAAEPSPATVMAARAAEMKARPPAEWDGVRVKTSKSAEAGAAA